MSTVGGGVITTGTQNNVWDDVTGGQSAAGVTEHRAIYVKNTNGSLTWQSVMYWIDAQVATDVAHDQIDVAKASEGVNVPIAETLGAETSIPTGVTFTTPTTKAGGVSLGNIPNGQYQGLWIRRVISAGASAASVSPSIRCEGDTAA